MKRGRPLRWPAPSFHAAAMTVGMRLLAVLVTVAVLTAARAGPLRADDEARFAEGLAAYDAGDYRTSFEAWRPLAEAGDVEAQVALAALYLGGLGVPADAGLAVSWYRRAAAAGDAVAQLNLGDFHLRGVGVQRDPVRAYAWFSLAAEQGRRWAALRRDELAGRLTPCELTEARDLIVRLRPAD